MSSASAVSLAGFLARRAGFGAPPDVMDQLSRMGVSDLISFFVEYDRVTDTSGVPEPVFSDKPDDYQDVLNLQHWWLARLVGSPRQLEEKMTLFWHSLFATSNEKVDRPSFMYQQNQLFRQYALGDFEELLTAVCIDPAMLLWLDGNYSFKGAPNENFAREVMELFTIGVGHYSQQDVREGARAFTGWYIDDNFAVQYSPHDHDGDSKTFLGQTGDFDYRDIARILANHPTCGRFLAWKLWAFFAYERPEDAILDELAGIYRDSGRSIRAVVSHMFGMPAFYSDRALTGRVKSPIEYVITAVRELGATVDPDDLNNWTYAMGQTVFYPPNVGGWATGTRWINTATAVARFNFAEWLLEQHTDPAQNRVDMGKLLQRYRAKTWDGTIKNFSTEHMLPTISARTWSAMQRFTVGHTPYDKNARKSLEAVLQLLMVSPEYYCA